MKKIIGLLVIVILVGGTYYHYDQQKDKTEHSIIVRHIDLDNDGQKERVVLENKKRDQTGDIYLKVDQAEYLVDADYNAPDYRMYELALEIYEVDGQSVIYVGLSQFVNGTGVNVHPGLYQYQTGEIIQLWEMPNNKTAEVVSYIEDDHMVFYDENMTHILTYPLSDLTAEKINVDSIEDIPDYIDDYFLSYPIHVEIKQSDQTNLVLSRVIRGPVIYAIYEENYKLTKNGVVLKDKRIDIDWAD